MVIVKNDNKLKGGIEIFEFSGKLSLVVCSNRENGILILWIIFVLLLY